VESSPQGAPVDRYVVLKYLAEGGMGAIYLGKKLGAGGFEKEVVLKQLLPEFTQQQEFIDLFLREARLSASLDHANIIHTIDLVTAGDEYFIVMEYLHGGDLRTLLKKAKRRNRRFDASAAIFVTREVLSALQYAHGKRDPEGKPLRLIHRDVSPSNILVSTSGEVKLTDFGIAKASTHNSVFYRVKGKVGYMSPEQARSEPLDHRSDLYSLAVCLYEMITGERLFVHAGLTTSPEEIYSQPIELVSRKVPGLPADLDKVMLKALAVDHNHRYQTAGEFQEALLRCAHKNGMMISGPELADHLVWTCGPPENWRDLRQPSQGGAGTEIYEPEGTEQIGVSDVSLDYEASDMLSVVGDVPRPSVFSDYKIRRQRAQTSITNLSRLQNLELTSMINIADMDAPGAAPLIDFEGMEADVADIGSSVQPLAPSELENALDTPSPIPDLHPQDVDLEPSDSVVVEDAVPGRSRMPWIVLLIILLAGIAVAIAIGLSGPRLRNTGWHDTRTHTDRAHVGEQSPPGLDIRASASLVFLRVSSCRKQTSQR